MKRKPINIEYLGSYALNCCSVITEKESRIHGQLRDSITEWMEWLMNEWVSEWMNTVPLVSTQQVLFALLWPSARPNRVNNGYPVPSIQDQMPLYVSSAAKTVDCVLRAPRKTSGCCSFPFAHSFIATVPLSWVQDQAHCGWNGQVMNSTQSWPSPLTLDITLAPFSWAESHFAHVEFFPRKLIGPSHAKTAGEITPQRDLFVI
jgi:hypothetical protein